MLLQAIKRPLPLWVAALTLLAVGSADQARGDLIFTLSEAVDGGVTVTGTGSGNVTGNFGGTDQIPVGLFSTDFINTGSGVFLSADSFSGTLTNVDDSTAWTVAGFGIIDGNNPGED